MLEEQILGDFKQAMKNKDKIAVSTLSFLRAQLKNMAIEAKKEGVTQNTKSFPHLLKMLSNLACSATSVVHSFLIHHPIHQHQK